MKLIKKFYESKYFEPVRAFAIGLAFSMVFITILAWMNGIGMRLTNGAY